MSYGMHQADGLFVIKAENKEAALSAVKLITFTDYSRLCWDRFANARTLEGALNVWRWAPDVDENDNIIDIYFEGYDLGDEDLLFNALAPYVEDGFIEMVGEDGDRWRWVFKNGACMEKEPKLVWE